ncbi:MAG TPA: hypothetical protein VM186_11590 [Planctomycetota bacterium]|nr:hypothetical protein [Planctomycetota bacterium]
MTDQKRPAIGPPPRARYVPGIGHLHPEGFPVLQRRPAEKQTMHGLWDRRQEHDRIIAALTGEHDRLVAALKRKHELIGAS